MNYPVSITAIVPSLPPTIGGVGDYSFLLAQQLNKTIGLKPHFIVGDPCWNHDLNTGDFEAQAITSRSKTAFLDHLLGATETILLHYVGHGYARRGCPSWLVEGLKQWRQTNPDRRLVTMFHELYATGPLWSSALLTSPLQKHLTTQLIQTSDVCLTSKQGYADTIRKLSRGKHFQVQTLPVFSNVGEPDQLPRLVDRPRRIVIFGGPGNRARVYERSRRELDRICHDLDISEILDIGPPLKTQIPPIHDVPVQVMGIQPVAVISDLLANSLAGFFNYHPAFLAKSTIFAAYCAHGMVPIGISYRAENTDGLCAEKHYWLADQAELSLNSQLAQEIADRAYAWYQNHCLEVQVKTFADSLTTLAHCKLT